MSSKYIIYFEYEASFFSSVFFSLKGVKIFSILGHARGTSDGM